MLKYLQVTHQFDTAALQAEVALLQEELWKQHYNTNHYQGGWSVIPLRSINGRMDNILSINASSIDAATNYCDTPLLQNCTYIRSVLDFFACEKTAVRLMKLHAGGMIKEHRDHDLNVEEGEARLHIPVITNEKVEFYLDDERMVMKEGECWYLNLSLKHSVYNCGETDRIHLVIDCLVNNWLKDLFSDKEAVQKNIPEKRKHAYSKEDKIKIICQLKLSGLTAAHELAEQLEKEME